MQITQHCEEEDRGTICHEFKQTVEYIEERMRRSKMLQKGRIQKLVPRPS